MGVFFVRFRPYMKFIIQSMLDISCFRLGFLMELTDSQALLSLTEQTL